MSSKICQWATALAIFSLTATTALGGHPLKETYPPEERVVMLQFQEALRASKWDAALQLCSEQVKAEAAKYKSLEIFFQDVVPVTQMVQMQTFHLRGGASKPGGGGLPVKADLYAKLLYAVQTSEPGVEWTWNTTLVNGRWLIDFGTCPLRDFIAHEIARHEWLAKDVRDVCLNSAVADAVITKVTTRITVLNTFVVGSPMLLRLELINGCDFDLVYDPVLVRIYGHMIVTTEDGRGVESTVGPVQTGVHYERVKSGETTVLFDNFDLSQHYNLNKPGRYKLQFSGFIHVGIPRPDRSDNDELPMWEASNSKSFPSNVIEIQVKAGPLSQ
jgi:hypothetical protein